jgi:hypothetical protein
MNNNMSKFHLVLNYIGVVFVPVGRTKLKFKFCQTVGNKFHQTATRHLELEQAATFMVQVLYSLCIEDKSGICKTAFLCA